MAHFLFCTEKQRREAGSQFITVIVKMEEKMAKDKNTNANENAEISKSKAKREERKKEVAKEKRHKLASRIVSITIVAAIVAVIVFFAGKSIYLSNIGINGNIILDSAKIDKNGLYTFSQPQPASYDFFFIAITVLK